MNDRTIYELTHGSNSGTGEARYFDPFEQCDAAVRTAERILELDRDEAVWAGWVHLKRLPDSIYPEGMTLISWTKTSNERPTAEGRLAP